MADFKLMIVGCRRAGMTRPEMQTYMRDVHGPKVLRNIELEPTLAPQRYVQNYTFDSSVLGDDGVDAGARALPSAPDFVTQVWFDHPAQAKAAVETAFYRDVLRPDEEHFVDDSTVVRLPSREQAVILGAVSAQPAEIKIFLFLAWSPGVDSEVAENALDRSATARAYDTSAGIIRRVRNRVLNRPGSAAASDIVDEFWFDTEANARVHASRMREVCHDLLQQSVVLRSSRILLARERVMFA